VECPRRDGDIEKSACSIIAQASAHTEHTARRCTVVARVQHCTSYTSAIHNRLAVTSGRGIRQLQHRKTRRRRRQLLLQRVVSVVYAWTAAQPYEATRDAGRRLPRRTRRKAAQVLYVRLQTVDGGIPGTAPGGGKPGQSVHARCWVGSPLQNFGVCSDLVRRRIQLRAWLAVLTSRISPMMSGIRLC
jgi:hypothetical protein